MAIPHTTEVWDILQLSRHVSSYSAITVGQEIRDFGGQQHSQPQSLCRLYEKKKKERKKNWPQELIFALSLVFLSSNFSGNISKI